MVEGVVIARVACASCGLFNAPPTPTRTWCAGCGADLSRAIVERPRRIDAVSILLGASLAMETVTLLICSFAITQLSERLPWLATGPSDAAAPAHLPDSARVVLWVGLAVAAWLDPRLKARHLSRVDWLFAVDPAQTDVRPRPLVLTVQRRALAAAVVTTGLMVLLGALGRPLDQLRLWLFCFNAAAVLLFEVTSAVVWQWVRADRTERFAQAVPSSFPRFEPEAEGAFPRFDQTIAPDPFPDFDFDPALLGPRRGRGVGAALGFVALVALGAWLKPDRPALAIPPPAAPVPAPASDVTGRPVLADWPGGSLSLDDFRRELDRVPTGLRDASPGWRLELVEAVATLRQLDAWARSHGYPGRTARERVRALVGPLDPQWERPALVAHWEHFAELQRTLTEKPRVIDLAALSAAERTGPAQLVVARPSWAAGQVTLQVDREPLRIDLYQNGFFALSRGVSPLGRLYVDLFLGETPLFEGQWVPSSPPTASALDAVGSQARSLPPRCRPAGELVSRYSVEMRSVGGFRSGSVEWQRFDWAVLRPLALCLANVAWDRRWKEAVVTLSANVAMGVAQDVKVITELIDSVPLPATVNPTTLAMPERCGLVLPDWKLPLEGPLIVRAIVTGVPWTDEEQADCWSREQ